MSADPDPVRWSKATVFPDMWVDPEEDPRERYADPVGEKQTLRYYLQHYRLTLAMKCDGLDAEQLARRSVPPSTLSLLGLVRHLAKVEHSWFRRVLQEQPEQPRLYWSADVPDLDFDGAVPDAAVVADAWATWEAEAQAADAWLDAFPEEDLGRVVPKGPDGTVPVRDVLVHLVEEYARHLGHADLLRECIDGRTGQ